MANNYLQTSTVLDLENEAERKRWEERLASKDKANEEGDNEAPSYEAKIEQEEDQHYSVWLYGEEFCNPDDIANAVQEFFKAFRPKACWGLTYAQTCSKMRIGEFGGGAMFITADSIESVDAYGWLEEQMSQHKRMLPK